MKVNSKIIRIFNSDLLLIQYQSVPKAHTFTPHAQQMVASTWMGDRQGRPSKPTNRLHATLARYQVQLTNTKQLIVPFCDELCLLMIVMFRVGFVLV